MTHRLVIGRFPPLDRFFTALGGVAGNPEAVRRELRAGRTVVCLPGGGVDSSRPLWQARRPSWGGRHGFARLALEGGVPVVPMAIHGAHLTYWILGELRLPRWLTRPFDDAPHDLQLTVGALALLGALAAALAGLAPWWVPVVAAATALFPNPVAVTVEFLPPVEARGCSAEDLAELVRSRVEAALRRGSRRPASTGAVGCQP